MLVVPQVLVPVSAPLRGVMVEAVTDAEILWICDVTPNNYSQNFTEITLTFLLLCSKIA